MNHKILMVQIVRVSQDHYWYKNDLGKTMMVRDYPNKSHYVADFDPSKLIDKKDVVILG